MPDNITIGDNIIIAKATQGFINAGIRAENTEIIYELEGSAVSYKPGRLINQVTGFTVQKGYLLKAKEVFDLSEYTVPPFTE